LVFAPGRTGFPLISLQVDLYPVVAPARAEKKSRPFKMKCGYAKSTYYPYIVKQQWITKKVRPRFFDKSRPPRYWPAGMLPVIRGDGLPSSNKQADSVKSEPAGPQYADTVFL